jgi:hypothetical protein
MRDSQGVCRHPSGTISMREKRAGNRPLDRDFYNAWRPRVSLAWLPEEWREFQTGIRDHLPPAPELTTVQQRLLFQAASAVRAAAILLDAGSNRLPGEFALPESATQSAALQLLLVATLKHLGDWGEGLSPASPPENPVGLILKYLFVDRRAFVEAVTTASSCDKCYFYLDGDSRKVVYSTAIGGRSELDLPEALLAGFLWWALISEWCWPAMEMS